MKGCVLPTCGRVDDFYLIVQLSLVLHDRRNVIHSLEPVHHVPVPVAHMQSRRREGGWRGWVEKVGGEGGLTGWVEKVYLLKEWVEKVC